MPQSAGRLEWRDQARGADARHPYNRGMRNAGEWSHARGAALAPHPAVPCDPHQCDASAACSRGSPYPQGPAHAPPAQDARARRRDCAAAVVRRALLAHWQRPGHLLAAAEGPGQASAPIARHQSVVFVTDTRRASSPHQGLATAGYARRPAAATPSLCCPLQAGQVVDARGRLKPPDRTGMSVGAHPGMGMTSSAGRCCAWSARVSPPNPTACRRHWRRWAGSRAFKGCENATGAHGGETDLTGGPYARNPHR